MAENFDGVLICHGNSKKQLNQFKRLFAKDNLSHVKKSDYYLQMRKLNKNSQDKYGLDVFVYKELVGHFIVYIVNPVLISKEEFEGINELSEKLFKEETYYGLSDFDGLDRVNNSIITGWGDYQHYPTISHKAAALWFKIASNQFFRNGNKRTALLSAIWFLTENMYIFNSTDGNELYDISVKAANREISVNQIDGFIRKNISLNYDAMASVLQGEPFEVTQRIDIHINK